VLDADSELLTTLSVDSFLLGAVFAAEIRFRNFRFLVPAGFQYLPSSSEVSSSCFLPFFGALYMSGGIFCCKFDGLSGKSVVAVSSFPMKS
jgi:hypothetical protein